MSEKYIAFLSFVTIITFTPGPNNISCASMGLLYGYKKTLKYILGIISGFFLLMLLCGFFSQAVLKLVPSGEKFLRLAGGIYIAWLAVSIFKSQYDFETKDINSNYAFVKGLFLQIVNVKAIVFGITAYSTFLLLIATKYYHIFFASLFLTLITFAAVSVWTLFGTLIKKYVGSKKVKLIINTVLSLFLLYTALELSGILR